MKETAAYQFFGNYEYNFNLIYREETRIKKYEKFFSSLSMDPVRSWHAQCVGYCVCVCEINGLKDTVGGNFFPKAIISIFLFFSYFYF